MLKRALLSPLALLLAAGVFLITACSELPLDNVGSNITHLIKVDNKLGDGEPATAGHNVSVHYTGWLYDEDAPAHHGMKFDSSRIKGQPYSFRLGAGRVIKGWDQGVEGMKVGGQRTLVIPSNLGYGERGNGRTIPPNATLVFDVELLAVN